MVIRRRQMAMFSGTALQSFEDRVSAHLDRCFPVQCKLLGEPGVRETIRYGIERASTYGIKAEREVCKYIDLMVVFGRDFDCDPGLPWASATLNNWRLKNSSVRLERLYETAKEHV